jgi:hypothetical protein
VHITRTFNVFLRRHRLPSRQSLPAAELSPVFSTSGDAVADVDRCLPVADDDGSAGSMFSRLVVDPDQLAVFIKPRCSAVDFDLVLVAHALLTPHRRYF